MRIRKLDHVNLVTARLSEMVAWYEEILGLASGPRPDFPFSGAWLYACDTAVVHLVEDKGKPRVGSEVALKIEHFALSATGMDQFEKILTEAGQPFEQINVPGTDLVQFHLADPDGNHIHVDFLGKVD